MAEMERQVFSDPWTVGAFRSLLGPHSYVAEQPRGGVVGYVIARLAADEGEVLNLAVDQGFRGQALGRQLLQRALASLAEAGAAHVYLEVRASNLGAQAFYRRMGFSRVGRRRRYYTRPTEDAIVLERPVGLDSGSA